MVACVKDDLEKILEAALPKSVAFASVDSTIDEFNSIINFKKPAFLGTASQKRRQDFLAGRTAVHMALQKLELSLEYIIERGQNGEPIWPKEILGSITHCDSLAVALVGYKSNYKAIGVDLENTARDLGERIPRKVCTDLELKWVEESTEEWRLKTIQLFSAKESLYKALYPGVGKFFGYQAVELKWIPSKGVFNARLCQDLSSDYRVGFECEIVLRLVEPYCLTWVVIV